MWNAVHHIMDMSIKKMKQLYLDKIEITLLG